MTEQTLAQGGAHAPTQVKTWSLYFDGLCEPKNPGGSMGWGWAIDIGDGRVFRGGGFKAARSENTNNISEWYALGAGLRGVQKLIPTLGLPEHLKIFGDSQLVVFQLIGKYRANKPELAAFRDKCHAILKEIDFIPDFWSAEWVSREFNAKADADLAANINWQLENFRLRGEADREP